MKLLERVSLFDTVNVEFPALGVSATAKAVKVVYDVIANRVKSVTLGSVRANIADTIANQQQEIEKKPSKTFMQMAVESLTKTLLGAKGGSVRILDENGDGEPDTLYIADNPDSTQAVKVWRFNYEGWGASKNGYNGPFTMGATFSDGIVADFITAGTLRGLLFKAGMIESLDGTIKIDLSGGKRAKFNAGIEANDLSMKPQNASYYTFRAISYEKKHNDESIPATKLVMFDFEGNEVFSVDHHFLVNEDGSNFRIDGTELKTSSQSGCYGSIYASESSADLDLYSSEGSHFGLRAVGENVVLMYLPDGIKEISWKSNGDGTSTLIGR